MASCQNGELPEWELDMWAEMQSVSTMIRSCTGKTGRGIGGEWGFCLLKLVIRPCGRRPKLIDRLSQPELTPPELGVGWGRGGILGYGGVG